MLADTRVYYATNMLRNTLRQIIGNNADLVTKSTCQLAPRASFILCDARGRDTAQIVSKLKSNQKRVDFKRVYTRGVIGYGFKSDLMF
jgi:hypothetical protein